VILASGFEREEVELVRAKLPPTREIRQKGCKAPIAVA